jgi:hypothetical protein
MCKWSAASFSRFKLLTVQYLLIFKFIKIGTTITNNYLKLSIICSELVDG